MIKVSGKSAEDFAMAGTISYSCNPLKVFNFKVYISILSDNEVLLDLKQPEKEMRKLLVLLMTLIMTTASNAAVYNFFNGEKLTEAALEWEKSRTHPKDSDLLLVTEYAGYVGALFDHLSEKQHICAPDEITKNQVLGAVAEYLKNNKKGLNYSGSILVEKALYKKYSCT